MADATIIVFNGGSAYHMTGRIVDERATGITIQTRNGCRWSAFNERIVSRDQTTINDAGNNFIFPLDTVLQNG